MTQRISVRLPVLTVKLGDFERIGGIESVKTSNVDVYSIGIAPRYVERMNSTVLAKMVLGDPGVEGVCRDVVQT